MRSFVPSQVTVNYWECLWNSMHQVGWSLMHSSYTDDDTGGPRHLVRASRGDAEVVCSAPTMTQAVQMVFGETRVHH
jgi:hypothetical protein